MKTNSSANWLLNSIKALPLALLLIGSHVQAQDSTQYAKMEHEGEVHWVKRINDTHVQLLSSAPWDKPNAIGSTFKLNNDELEIPFSGTNVLAIGLNYRSHAGDSGAAKPEVFFKSVASLALNDKLNLGEDINNLHFEGELVLVIGQECDKVSIEQANSCIFGYLAGNDLTERSWQSRDLQWWRAKGAKGFAPISPWVTTFSGKAPDFMITTKLNGEVMQQESSANMIHTSEAIVAFISQYIPLQAGDLIFTGTPGRTQALKSSDIVSVEISNIGRVETEID